MTFKFWTCSISSLGFGAGEGLAFPRCRGARGEAGRRQTDECTGPGVVPEVQAPSSEREATMSNEAERASCSTAGAAAPQWRQPPANAFSSHLDTSMTDVGRSDACPF